MKSAILSENYIRIVIFSIVAALNSSCTVNWGCGEKALPKAEEAAVQELMTLNRLDSIRPNRIASQYDVEGCESGHILDVTASEMNLDTIPPSISSFSKLQTLLLGNNNLKSLPIEITNLNPIHVSIRGNEICDPLPEIDVWAAKWDSTWRKSQRCP